MSTSTKKKKKAIYKNPLSLPYVLILENDDYNTFDHVISCLMSICGHEQEQATQCAHLVHFKGRCDVKYGDFETISGMKEKLRNAGLIATMDING